MGGQTWRNAHEDRAEAVELLRLAGYQARSWSRERVGQRQVATHLVDDWRYLEGPAKGCQAVDPWDSAEHLAACGSDWHATIRRRRSADLGHGLVALPLPHLCNRVHVCPVCAGLRSRAVAGALRRVLQADQSGAPVYFVTLTHRARGGEPLTVALDRWRDAWRRMTRGRPGRRFASLVAGYYYGLEVTRGRRSSVTDCGRWWHVHAHVLVLGRQAEDLAPPLGALWRQATASASGRDGWHPPANMQRTSTTAVVGWRADVRPASTRWIEPMPLVEGRLAGGDWAGPWCQKIDLTDPDLPQVYQAAKYPTPVVALHPVALAEYLSAAHGRRWHQGGGAWRSVLRDAETLAREQLDEELPSGRVDLGDNVVRAGPGDCPRMAEVVERDLVDFLLVDDPAVESWAWDLESDGYCTLHLRRGWRNAVASRWEAPARVEKAGRWVTTAGPGRWVKARIVVPERQVWLRFSSSTVRARMDAILAELGAASAEED